MGEDDSIQKAAGIMAKRNIRRLPVVRDGKLVGILSRADLMKAIVAPPAQAPGETSDAEIERKLVAEMRRHSWADAYYIFPHVEKGTCSSTASATPTMWSVGCACWRRASRV